MKKDTESCDLLIIRSESEETVKFAGKIVHLCHRIKPEKSIVVEDIRGRKPEQNVPVPDKVLFLLLASSGESLTEVEQWLAVLRKFSRLGKKSVLIVHEIGTSGPFADKFCDKKSLVKWKVLDIKSLSAVFSWWPEVLEFVYDIEADDMDGGKVTKSPSNKVRPSPREVKPLLDEQQQLKQNIDVLVSRCNGLARKKQFHAETKAIIAVAFGQDTTIPFYAHSRYRQAKINYGKVLFFFTAEVEFNPYIKDLSTHTFYPGQHMEGITLLQCVLASLTFQDRQDPYVLGKPNVPLYITTEGISWGRMEQMGNCSLSLQSKDPDSGHWKEIDPRVPLFQTDYPLRRSSMDATKEFRLVQADDFGELSEPLYYTETTRQYIYRKFLAILISLLILPNVLLTLAFAPFMIGAFIGYRKRKGTLFKRSNLNRNSKLAGVIFWVHCAMGFIIGGVAIILQLAYQSLHVVSFWFGLLIPFILVCLNIIIRGLFSKYASHSLITTTVAGYVMPPVDVCCVYWNTKFMSFYGTR